MISSTNLNSYVQMYTSAQRKIAVPVASSAVMYSQFKYVSGYEDSANGGVSIDRVHILDTLINQLITAKNSNIKVPAFEQMTTEQVDKLITDYQGQVARNFNAAQASAYVETPTAPTGVVFNIAS